MASAPELPQGIDAQHDQHQADAQLQRLSRPRADLEVEENDGEADDEQRDGVADAPETADER
jgi:hypothetical protein